MKSVAHQFRVSYWLSNAYHEYIIDATNKIDAKRRVLDGMVKGATDAS